jgi:two-component system, chemotaxis family, CheB/CheR fusion protein
MAIKTKKKSPPKVKSKAANAPVKKRRSSAKVTKGTKPPVKKTPTPKNMKNAPVLENQIVVGIGASAGGIEALREFFRAIPSDSGMTFVVIQHLDPKRESMMASLISACTSMSTVQIKRRTPLKANHVYVTPPNKSVNIINDYVSLTKPLEKRGAQMPINYFFHALAKAKHESAIGIILSGTGADGSSGLRSIKENGGLCIAQDPKTAGYDAMPVNAINTGMVDFILPVAKMPDVLIRYSKSPYVAGKIGSDPLKGGVSPDHLTSILALLKTRLKRDFHYYKKSTLIRRVNRRMGIVHVNTMQEYLAYLRKKPSELDKLFKDILIGVTQFFRDPDVFDQLAKRVIPKIVKNRDPDEQIRVWVAGCSTGEEAYTIAILLIEALSARKLDINLLIFATDIDATALNKARNGTYPKSIEADITTKRLRRFFIKDGDNYRVVKQLRECVAFAEQNLISDPPFSKLDLISCRNLLIYVEPELQRKIISLFQYSLNDHGYLLLGSSETIGRLGNLFKLEDKKSRLYKSISQVRQPQVDFPIISLNETKPRKLNASKKMLPKRIIFSDLTHRLLSETYAPASVLINNNGEPLHFFGPTDRYLKLPSGDFQQDIIAMARDGLTTKLRGLINKSVRSNEPLTMDKVSIKSLSGIIEASVSVSPVLEPKEAVGLYLVTFSENRKDQVKKPVSLPRKTLKNDSFADNRELERELQATREDLQSTIEEMETSNEELKASNEEAMSMNEELQSSNEELETSKEEMQSLNEELNTVNTELQDKVDQLEVSRNDIANLLASTDIGTLFLDTKLCIKRFTPAVTKLINIQSSDEGRKLSDFTKTFKDIKLVADCKSVFDKLVPIERELQANDGDWYIRRILPYRTEENKIGGVVITFTEITDIKEAEVEAVRLASIIRDSNDAVILQGLNGQILAWNSGATKMYGYPEGNALKMNIRQLVPKKGRIAALDLIYQALNGGIDDDIIAKRVTRDKRVLDVMLTVTVLKNANGENYAIATTERDITQRLQLERELQKSHDELEARVRERTTELNAANEELRKSRDEAESANATKTNFLATMSHDLRTPLNGILGYSEAILTNQLGLTCGIQCLPQIQHVFDASTHLHSLINDILDISAVEVGKLELYEEKIKVVDVMQSCQRLVNSEIEKKGIDFRVTITKGTPKELNADKRRLMQILVNLLSNAIKVSKKKQRITFAASLNKKGELVFRIADKGCGMSKEEIAIALEPFSQVDSLHTRVSEGTGLGLPIAREFTQAHGGTLKVTSKLGDGTTVRVILPAKRVRKR